MCSTSMAKKGKERLAPYGYKYPDGQEASHSLHQVFLSQGGFLMERCNDLGCYERALQENHGGKVQR